MALVGYLKTSLWSYGCLVQHRELRIDILQHDFVATYTHTKRLRKFRPRYKKKTANFFMVSSRCGAPRRVGDRLECFRVKYIFKIVISKSSCSSCEFYFEIILKLFHFIIHFKQSSGVRNCKFCHLKVAKSRNTITLTI